MNSVRCLRFATSKVHPLLIGNPRCFRFPKKVPSHPWIAVRCFSLSPARLADWKAETASEIVNRFDTQPVPDKELIDLTSAGLLNTTEQIIQKVAAADTVLSASDLGMSSFLLPRVFYDLLTILHDTTSWAWVPTIAASCLLMRTCMFPLYVQSKKEMIGFIGQMVDVQKDIQGFDVKGPPQQILAGQQKAMKSISDLQRSMPRVFASPLASAVVFSSYYFCLRAMANHPIPSMQAESFLWVPSLTAADPYSLFPLLTASTMFITLYYNMESGAKLDSKMMKLTCFILPAIIFTVTSTMPANLTIYWFINNNITVLCHLICSRPKIKSYLKIPDAPNMDAVGPTKMMSFQEGFRESLERVERVHEIEERNRLMKQVKQDDIIKKTEELKRLIEEYQRNSRKPD